MDHERLDHEVEKVDRRTQANAKDEAKEEARRTKRNLRRQERLSPYQELKARNQAIFDRANILASIFPPVAEPNENYPNQSTERQVNIVIGPAKSTPTTPNHVLVARVSTSQWHYNNQPREQARLAFVSVDQDLAAQIQRDPGDRRVLAQSDYKDLAEESTYVGGLEGEVYERARSNVSGRLFSPVMALHRISDIRDISQRLEDLEQSMHIIDEAATNPELNPVLVPMFGSASQSEQATL